MAMKDNKQEYGSDLQGGHCCKKAEIFSMYKLTILKICEEKIQDSISSQNIIDKEVESIS